MNKQIKSIFILLLTALIWGVAFVAQCEVDNDALGNFGFNGIRFLLGSVSLIPVILLFERDNPDKNKIMRTLRTGAVTGVALFAASALQMEGLSINHNAGKGGFITGLYTVWVPFLSYIVFKKKIHANTWISAIMSAVGLYLLSGGFDKINYGDAVILAGSAFWAIHILLIDTFLETDISPLKYSFVQFVTCGLLNLIFAAFTETITLSGISANTVPILYTGIMSTGVAYTCQVIGQKDCKPTLAAIILSTECVFSAISGAILLHEVMKPEGYIGCVLIFAGIIISQLNGKENENAAEGSDNTCECAEHQAS